MNPSISDCFLCARFGIKMHKINTLGGIGTISEKFLHESHSKENILRNFGTNVQRNSPSPSHTHTQVESAEVSSSLNSFLPFSEDFKEVT